MKKHTYTEGFLAVSEVHELYYEGWGNAKGFPILFVHGGPGTGSGSPRYRKWFDPRRHNVIFFDQRGAAKSRPFCELKDNSTDLLVEDINKVLDHFSIGKALLVGGSWGSTLSLVYAIRHPERVSGLFLRALFLANQAAHHQYLGGGLKTYFPEAWERFVSFVPKRFKNNPAPFYYKQMRATNSRTREKFSYEWAYYELSFLQLKNTELTVQKFMKDLNYKSLSMLEAHYLSQNCFLPEDYILKNAKRLRDIPMTLLHGRYDVICPPEQAWALKKKLPKLHLEFDVGGHIIPDQSYNVKFARGIKEIIQKVEKRQ